MPEREEAQMVSFISSRRLADVLQLLSCLIDSVVICCKSGLSEISMSFKTLTMKSTM